MVADHANYLTFEDPGAVNTVRRALKLAEAGDLLGAAETAGVEMGHAAAVHDGLRRGMRFSIGAEIDNDPRARPDAQNIVDAMRPDGIIRSVHFVPIHHPEKGPDWLWPFDNEEFASLYDVVSVDTLWELYTSKLLDDLEKLPAHIVGHFYVPATLGRWPTQKKLEEHEDAMLDVAHRRGLAVEVNTRFLYRDHPEDRKKKYLDANARLVRKAKARGVGIAIGSDAHSPKDQGGAFDVILKLLDDARINEVVFPVAGRLARVALRATREHLEAQAQARRQPSAPGSSISGYSRAELGLPEEAEGAARGARAARVVGPKKRASDSSRPSKRPSSGSAPAASSSRRSSESASSASKAKAARSGKAAAPKKKKAVEKKPAAKRPAPAARTSAGTSHKSKPPPKKATVKKAPAKKTAAKRPAAKSAAPKKKAVKKTVSKKPVSRAPVKPKRQAAGSAKKSIKKKKPAPKRR